MAEGAIETESFAPTLNSKTTKGKTVKKLEEVPPNAGKMVILAGAAIFFLALLFIVPQKWFEHQSKKADIERKEELEKYTFVLQEGWRGIDRYVFSDARKSYSAIEFPMKISSAARKGDDYEIQMLAINKTATTLEVSAYFDSEDENINLSNTKNSFNISIPPMQATPIIVKTNIPKNANIQKLFISVSYQFGTEYIYGLRFYPVLNKVTKKALEERKLGRLG